MKWLFLFALRVPLGLDAYVPVPTDNPLTLEKVVLGKKLFFDPRLSRDGTVSCSSCHQPDLAFSDKRKLAIGIAGRVGERRSPRIVNRAYGKAFFWDGRAASLEEQVAMPIENPKEMDLAVGQAAKRVGLTETELRQALASYVRTILSGDSAYDRYVSGDHDALSDIQKQGLSLFRGKAGCVNCHLGPNLTDERRHNTGMGSFKTPTMREVARTPPYMHDGSLASMEDVIEFYDKGGRATADLDPEMHPLHLTTVEKSALIEFLKALNGKVSDGL